LFLNIPLKEHKTDPFVTITNGDASCQEMSVWWASTRKSFFHLGGREPHSNKYANNYEKQPFPVFHLPSLIFIFFFLEVGYFPNRLQRTSKKVRMEKEEILISLRTLKCKR